MENKTWKVTFCNSLDDGFGYACGDVTMKEHLTKAVAKSIARHMNKIAPEFVVYRVSEWGDDDYAPCEVDDEDEEWFDVDEDDYIEWMASSCGMSVAEFTGKY